jgi:hypothetical protein
MSNHECNLCKYLLNQTFTNNYQQVSFLQFTNSCKDYKHHSNMNLVKSNSNSRWFVNISCYLYSQVNSSYIIIQFINFRYDQWQLRKINHKSLFFSGEMKPPFSLRHKQFFNHIFKSAKEKSYLKLLNICRPQNCNLQGVHQSTI